MTMERAWAEQDPQMQQEIDAAELPRSGLARELYEAASRVSSIAAHKIDIKQENK